MVNGWRERVTDTGCSSSQMQFQMTFYGWQQAQVFKQGYLQNVFQLCWPYLYLNLFFYLSDTDFKQAPPGHGSD